MKIQVTFGETKIRSIFYCIPICNKINNEKSNKILYIPISNGSQVASGKIDHVLISWTSSYILYLKME